MADEISIWRWAITTDLDALFARAIAATDDALIRLNAEHSALDPAAHETLDDIEAKAEEKFRAMNLPAEVFKTMMAGFKDMMAEARQEDADWDDDDDEDDPVLDPDGRAGFALASSHMFYDDPYASLDYEEIERQVRAQMDAYRAAISKALGDPGQSLADFLGISPERSYEDDVFDALMEKGLAEVEWVWINGDRVVFLSEWHEDKELPIDLEFGRAPRALFDDVKAAL